MAKSLSTVLFRIPTEQATFACRGFYDGNRKACKHLEKVGHTFILGYHAALQSSELKAVIRELNSLEPEFRGFAFEGAAMAITLTDNVFPWRNRLAGFLTGPATAHIYMAHVGVGWAIARLKWLRRHIENSLRHLDDLLRWLAVDGYGFHEGYFHWPKYVIEQSIPKQLKGYSRRAFDQGLGRSLWFVDGADVDRIAETIGRFASRRRADLWSGVGLAASYAGGVEASSMSALRQSAGGYWPELAQGAAFAAKARQRAGIVVNHTEVACQLLCGISSDRAARITDEALNSLTCDGEEPAYEVWRTRVRDQLLAITNGT